MGEEEEEKRGSCCYCCGTSGPKVTWLLFVRDNTGRAESRLIIYKLNTTRQRVHSEIPGRSGLCKQWDHQWFDSGVFLLPWVFTSNVFMQYFIAFVFSFD